MKRIVAGVLTGLLASLPTSAPASTFFEQSLRCPVGGKTFTATLQGSSSSFGQRPDGKPYSTVLAPPPECPDNGFVFYKETYTPAEQAALTRLVLSPEYRGLRREAGAHYRRYWLMTQMAEPIDARAETLLVASWNNDDLPAAKERYQREFVGLVSELPANTKDLFWFRARAANLLRELGEHDRANGIVAELKSQLPSIANAEARGNWSEFLAAQQVLNAERNTSSEPLTLVPSMIAAGHCVEATRTFTASERARCDSPELRKEIEDARTSQVREFEPKR
jgi:hypothetical protein